MIVRFLIFTLALLAFIAWSEKSSDTYRYIPNYVWGPGEKITYRAHYGFITAGTGEMIIHDDIYEFNGRKCYKLEIIGKSGGLFEFVMHIEDYWGTYFDVESIIPHYFYRNLQEGRYRKWETTDFNHETDTATVITFDKVTKKIGTLEKFAVPDNAQDMAGGYYYLRLLDFSKFTKGDTIIVDSFFDDTSYNFKILYLGKEKLNTAIGKINSIILQPIMPKNKLFDGENSITVWISDDINKVPLKARANMFIGAVEIEITEYTAGKRKQRPVKFWE